MLDKMIIAFFIFGCWAKFIPDTIGFLMFNIWYVLVLFWMILNGLGVFSFFFSKNQNIRAFCERLDPAMENRWVAYNLMAVISFCAANCWTVATAYVMTSVLFMILTISTKKDIDKKKNKK